MHTETVLIDFHYFSLLPRGFEDIRARKVAGLWHPVAGCAAGVLPHQDDAIKQAALCNIGRLQFAVWEITRYCSDC